MRIVSSDFCICMCVFVYVYSYDSYHSSNATLFSECKMFEADWTKRKIENATQLIIPILHGDEIPIRCASGYEKSSGPDAVTCLQNTSFTGLDDIQCNQSGKHMITFPFGKFTDERCLKCYYKAGKGDIR